MIKGIKWESHSRDFLKLSFKYYWKLFLSKYNSQNIKISAVRKFTQALPSLVKSAMYLRQLWIQRHIMSSVMN